MEKLLEAADLAKTAVKFDQDNCLDAAIYYYKEAAQLIRNVSSSVDPTSLGPWVEKGREYLERARILSLPKEERPVTSVSPEMLKLKQCKFLFYHALDADEAGQKDTALSLYTQAIEMCLQTKNETSDAEVKKRLQTVAVKALERAEQLKGVRPEQARLEESNKPPAPRPTTSRQVGHSERELRRGFSSHLVVCGNPSLAPEEKKVLLTTSRINHIDYLPFMDIDLQEKFQFALPFSDKDGLLALSPEQKRHFSRWARPDEICSEPKMLINPKPDCYSIRQTIISDCSFVASLAISALYEKKFNTSLITAIIYPKNRNSQPIYNPFGKYMVKLHLNGVTRKVIIDDLLPVGKHNELLCSFSTNRSEFWISLLEKAYMKVMGGYDFPGSNSSIDLHALTGWIPDRQQILASEANWPADEVFNRLLMGLHSGDLLATVATGELTEEQATRAGLVPTHAYALLDARLLNGVQLLKLKNPWSHVRWKGNYSELDKDHWTTALQTALDYDPKSAVMFDNGVFWIDYKSIQKFFDVFYYNWNPKLFHFTSCLHQWWDGGVGPVKDSYTVGENPQYRLKVEPGSAPTPASGHHRVWVLLTRHITSIEDFRHNMEFITLLVFKNNGNRVYYPHDPPPYLDGQRINSPHYLTKIDLKDAKTNRFTLVVSQYKKTTTIYYTLRAYATCKFSLEKIVDPYRHTKKVESDSWRGDTAGGCRNHPSTYYNNPTYRLVTESPAELLLELRAPKQFPAGMELSSPAPIDGFSTISSAPYRTGYVVLSCSVPAGTFHLIPSTFLPGQESPFFLSVRSSAPFTLTRFQ